MGKNTQSNVDNVEKSGIEQIFCAMCQVNHNFKLNLLEVAEENGSTWQY